MTHNNFHDEIFFLSLKFYFILWRGHGGLQEQRVDMKGREMDGIEMHDVKDTWDK